jgi:hypothetical protein
MTCDRCDRFGPGRDFTSSDAKAFFAFHARLLEAVESGALEVNDGDVRWGDVILCTLQCSRCEKRFRLSCDTYHGSGGEWRVEPGGHD